MSFDSETEIYCVKSSVEMSIPLGTNCSTLLAEIRIWVNGKRSQCWQKYCSGVHEEIESSFKNYFINQAQIGRKWRNEEFWSSFSLESVVQRSHRLHRLKIILIGILQTKFLGDGQYLRLEEPLSKITTIKLEYDKRRVQPKLRKSVPKDWTGPKTVPVMGNMQCYGKSYKNKKNNFVNESLRKEQRNGKHLYCLRSIWSRYEWSHQNCLRCSQSTICPMRFNICIHDWND